MTRGGSSSDFLPPASAAATGNWTRPWNVGAIRRDHHRVNSLESAEAASKDSKAAASKNRLSCSFVSSSESLQAWISCFEPGRRVSVQLTQPVVTAPHVVGGLLVALFPVQLRGLPGGADPQAGVLAVPFLDVDLGDRGTTERVPTVGVQSAKTVGTDWQILPSEFRGCGAGEACHQDRIPAEPVDSAPDLAGKVGGLPGPRRAEDAVLPGDGVIPLADFAKGCLYVRIRHQPLHRRWRSRQAGTRSEAATTDFGL